MGLRLWRIAVAAIILPAGPALLMACTTSSASRDVPAVIVDPTPASRAELRLAIQRALHSAPILLADDALTHSDLLPIDRAMRRDPQGRPLNGLDVHGRPELFRLVKSGNSCVLVHQDSEGLRQTLPTTKCQPVARKR